MAAVDAMRPCRRLPRPRLRARRRIAHASVGGERSLPVVLAEDSVAASLCFGDPTKLSFLDSLDSFLLHTSAGSTEVRVVSTVSTTPKRES